MPEAPYPNRLAECMAQAKVNDPQLAEAAGTTKQQIFKLRRGERKLTVEWARRLAPHLKMPWRALIDGPATNAEPPHPMAGYGQRIAVARAEREQTEEEFAAELGAPVEMVRLWEADLLAPDVPALAKLRRVGISADWVLFGDWGRREAPATHDDRIASETGHRGRRHVGTADRAPRQPSEAQVTGMGSPHPANRRP